MDRKTLVYDILVERTMGQKQGNSPGSIFESKMRDACKGFDQKYINALEILAREAAKDNTITLGGASALDYRKGTVIMTDGKSFFVWGTARDGTLPVADPQGNACHVNASKVTIASYGEISKFVGVMTDATMKSIITEFI